jgi:hypothetical protein
MGKMGKGGYFGTYLVQYGRGGLLDMIGSEGGTAWSCDDVPSRTRVESGHGWMGVAGRWVREGTRARWYSPRTVVLYNYGVLLCFDAIVCAVHARTVHCMYYPLFVQYYVQLLQ